MSSPVAASKAFQVTRGGGFVERLFSATSASATDLKSRKKEEAESRNTMASDAEYTDFLERANRDPGEGVVKSEGKPEGFKTMDSGVVVPTVLKKAVVDAFYTSDADEPFEVVGLRFEEGKLPDEGLCLLSLCFLDCSLSLPSLPFYVTCLLCWMLHADGFG